jgi:hypothetical protein
MPSNDRRKTRREAEKASDLKAEKSDKKASIKEKREVKGERTASKVSFKKKPDKKSEDMGEPKFMHRAPYGSFNIKKVVIDEPGKGFTPPEGKVVIYMPIFNYRYPIFNDDGSPKIDEGGNPIEELHPLKFEGPRAPGEQMFFRWGITEKLVALTDNEKERKAKGETIVRKGTNKFKCAGELEYSVVNHKTLRRIFLELSDIAIYYLWQNGAESDANGLGTTNKYDGLPDGEDGNIGLTIHNYPDCHIRNPVWYKSEKDEKEVRDPKTKKLKTVTVPKFIETAPATLTFDVNIGHTAYRTDFRYLWREKVIIDGKPIEVIKKKVVTKNSELKLKGFVAIPVFELKMSINNATNRIRLDATTFIITRYLTARENEQGLTMRELENDMKGTNGNVYTRDELVKMHPGQDDLASVTSSEDVSIEKNTVKKMLKTSKDKRKGSSGSDEAKSGSNSSIEEARDSKKKKKKQRPSSESSSSSGSSSAIEEITKRSVKKPAVKSVPNPPIKSSAKPTKKPSPEESKEDKSTATIADEEASTNQSEVEASEVEESVASGSETDSKHKIKLTKTLKLKGKAKK